jgi:hypothetical protein
MGSRKFLLGVGDKYKRSIKPKIVNMAMPLAASESSTNQMS